MKQIPLTQGQFALVDDEDYDFLMQWNWMAHKQGNTYYAERNTPYKKGEKRTQIKMHRVVMDTPNDMIVDHKDHNGLNNQKSNLRNCTDLENSFNKTKRDLKLTSKYKGVYLKRNLKPNGKEYFYFCAHISRNGKRVNLGNFFTEDDAGYAYNEAAIKYHGEYAVLNKLPDGFLGKGPKPIIKTSKHKGIGMVTIKSKKKKTGKVHLNTYWQAKIWHNKKRIIVGSFKTEEEAIVAYNKKQAELFGDKEKIIIN